MMRAHLSGEMYHPPPGEGSSGDGFTQDGKGAPDTRFTWNFPAINFLSQLFRP